MQNKPSNQINSWYYAQNPLLSGLPQFDELADFTDALAFDPLDGIDVGSLSFMDRDALLVGEKVPFEPTMQNLRTAMTWQGMLISGLRARNPLLPQAQSHYWATLRAVANEERTLPAAPTAGMSIHVVKGPTGTGKSVTVKRFCKLYDQVIRHPKNDAAGWNEMTQLVYLDVMISHDGSRGGFLQGILMQMDLVLGTSYATELPKRYRTVEKLAGAVIGRLIAHHCGILFVDEAQLRNLVDSGQAELMQTFLLLIMNSGIPTVMVGNEVAFDWVTYSQDLSRLNMIPQEIFAPVGENAHSGSEDDWDAISTGIMRYYVLKNPVVNPEECKRLLRQYSGGIARLGLTLWCAMQRDLLFAGKESAVPGDLTHAYESSSYDKLRPLADGFHFRKPELLLQFPDVNAAHYAKLWGIPWKSTDVSPAKPKPTESQPIQPQQAQPKKRPVSEQAKFAKEQTRKIRRNNKRVEVAQSLSDDDIRKQGLVNVHLQGLSGARAAAEEDGKLLN